MRLGEIKDYFDGPEQEVTLVFPVHVIKHLQEISEFSMVTVEDVIRGFLERHDSVSTL